MQGFRNKKNLDINLKAQKMLVERKDFFNPKKEGEEAKWAKEMTNLLFSWASNR